MEASQSTDFDLRPMEPADVRAVLEIVRQHDDDDYRSAQQSYRESLEDHFVLTRDQLVIGCTGAREIEGTERSFRLSWTYVHPQYQGMGCEPRMLKLLFDELRNWDARKLFVNASDYYDVQHANRFDQLLKAYQSLGFVQELLHPHYYDRDESLITFGKRLQETTQRGERMPSDLGAVLTGVDEIPETDDAYFIGWELSEDEPSTPAELAALVQKARKWRGRVIFVGVPSDAPQVNQLFQNGGFSREGQLRDFYADGVDELHFRFDLL